jgi:hypothetical protein
MSAADAPHAGARPALGAAAPPQTVLKAVACEQGLGLQLFADFGADAHQVGARRLGIALAEHEALARYLRLLGKRHGAPRAGSTPTRWRTTTSGPKLAAAGACAHRCPDSTGPPASARRAANTCGGVATSLLQRWWADRARAASGRARARHRA